MAIVLSSPRKRIKMSKFKPIGERREIPHGREVHIKLKPTSLRSWIVVGQSENCLILAKTRLKKGQTYKDIKAIHVPFKNVDEIDIGNKIWKRGEGWTDATGEE